VPLEERAEALAALRAVDAVVAFGSDTAIGVVGAVRPDVYVKGGDYDLASKRPPEVDAAEACGARVVFLPYAKGHSTSELVDRIARRWR
jgi:bifunctional ADP-heptose synthase (sugar kinase/adenylyltransferase)